MKGLKKYMLATFIVLGATGAIFAQEEKKDIKLDKKHEFKKEHHGERAKHDMKISNLTEAQKAELAANKKAFHEQVKNVKIDESLSEDAKKEKLKALYKENFTAMQEVLTEEQRAEVKERFEKRKLEGKRNYPQDAQRKEKHEKAKGEFKRPSQEEMAQMKIERLDKAVTLTAKQKEQVLAISNQNMEKRQALRKDENLSKEDKMQDFKALKQTERAEINKVLTKKQIQLLEEQRAQQKTKKVERRK